MRRRELACGAALWMLTGSVLGAQVRADPGAVISLGSRSSIVGKDPSMATMLSFFVPGTGQMYFAVSPIVGPAIGGRTRLGLSMPLPRSGLAR